MENYRGGRGLYPQECLVCEVLVTYLFTCLPTSACHPNKRVKRKYHTTGIVTRVGLLLVKVRRLRLSYGGPV